MNKIKCSSIIEQCNIQEIIITILDSLKRALNKDNFILKMVTTQMHILKNCTNKKIMMKMMNNIIKIIFSITLMKENSKMRIMSATIMPHAWIILILKGETILIINMVLEEQVHLRNLQLKRKKMKKVIKDMVVN